MICRNLRGLIIGRLFVSLALSLALAVTACVAGPSLPLGEEEATAIVFRAIQVPLVALAPGGPVFRSGKQAQTPRFAFQKPERSGRLTAADWKHPRHSWSAVHHRTRMLPRHTLASRRFALQSPSDASDPFLVSPSTS